MPDRIFEEIKSGPRKGARCDRDNLKTMRTLYYQMMNWDPETGIPTRGKLVDLDLAWVIDELEKAGKFCR